MTKLTKKKILNLIAEDAQMMEILCCINDIGLPDWYVFAGFIRDKVWDHIHGHVERTPIHDVDIAYFDPHPNRLDDEIRMMLQHKKPAVHWDVRNQSFAHIENKDLPYTDCADALSKQPDTVMSIGIRIAKGKLVMVSPHGISDLISCTIRPTPIMYQIPERKQIVIDRLSQKQLAIKWPLMKVHL